MTDKIEISIDDSDRGDSDEENSEEGNFKNRILIKHFS